MTCVVAIVDKTNNIHIGSDSLASDSHTQTVMTDSKIFMLGEMIIGFAGSFRSAQLLRHAMALPGREESQEDMEYLVTSFLQSVRIAFMDGGILRTQEGVEEFDGEFIIGYRGKVYHLQGDFSLLHSIDDFMAIGEGGEAAGAVLYATKNMKNLKPTDRLTLALDAASYQITSVKPPFHLKSVDVDGFEIEGK